MGICFGLIDEAYKHTSEKDQMWPAKKEIHMAGAKNQKAAFQVLLRNTEEYMLSVSHSPAFSPVGPLENIRLEISGLEEAGWEKTVYIEGMIEDDHHILTADLLLHQDYVTVEKNKIQGVWVEAVIPEDAAAGFVQGEVKLYRHTLFEDETLLETLPFTIEVKDVVLPGPEDYSFYLDLWQHLSNIARKHETPLWSEEHFTVIENYVKSLAELGQKAVTIIATEIPWSGQRCFRTRDDLADLFEYSMIQVLRDKEGQWIFDFTVMDRYIELCFSYGIDWEIEVFGLSNIWMDEEAGYGKLAEDFPDGCRVRYLDIPNGCFRYMRQGEDICLYIKSIEQHFLDKGWIDRVRVVADEPSDTELYRQRINLLKEIAPSFTFKTAINHAEFIQEFKDTVKDYVPVLPCVSEQWELIQSLKKTMTGRISWYVCCWPPLPNTFIHSPLHESCLIGWLTAYMGLDGFLRWNYTVWPENPRKKISYRYPGWFAGDTNFVYPGNDGRPVLTLRYKMLKRGIEDFEIIKMVEREHPRGKEILSKAYSMVLRTTNIGEFHPSKGRNPEDLYSLDYNDYQQARRFLLEELEKLKK